MRLKLRRSRLPVGRQRQLPADQPKVSSFSYHQQRSDEITGARQPDREIKRPRLQSWRTSWYGRFGLALLIMLVIIGLINALVLTPGVQFKPLTGSDTTFLAKDQQAYQAAARQFLSGSVLNRTKLTINSGGLSQHLQRQFPELASVTVTTPLFAHQPVVYLQAVQPVLVLLTSSGAFVLDNNGRALQQVSQLSAQAEADIPQVTDQSSAPVHLHDTALPPNYVTFIQTVYGQLQAKQYHVSSMTLPAVSSELDVHLTRQGYYIKFNLQTNDARQQAGTFLATMAQLKQQNITPSQYVDVRLDGRAYYQ